MRFLKVLVLIIAVVSFLPMDGICEDHHIGDGQEHHCVLACHTCHPSITPATQSEVYQLSESTALYFQHSFQYQAPILDQTHRPPIVSL